MIFFATSLHPLQLNITVSFILQDLEDFIAGAGESGFIYISMGSSVKAANMPEELRRLLLKTFSQLPYRVLWKWEASSKDMADLPPNVRLGRWLPQQDILGDIRLLTIFRNILY